ncbi:casein kinase II subunit alpha'-interacting protein-like isoform X2 [Monodelphis domestica]|nr:casein kinase II subunit alpha'-interacting protein-like isoform X2 [Monodelphis domestica]XP_016280225.1 casein kinase II subunit alpha'-interacting protein-like isoform X2 [Monodelphis domestica]
MVLLPCPPHWIASLSNQNMQPKSKLKTTDLGLKSRPELLPSSSPWTTTVHSGRWTLTSSIINPYHRGMAKLLTNTNIQTTVGHVSCSDHQPSILPLFNFDNQSKFAPLSSPDHQATIVPLPYLKNQEKATRPPPSKIWAGNTTPYVSLPNLMNPASATRISPPKSFSGNRAPISSSDGKGRASISQLSQTEHHGKTPFCLRNQINILLGPNHLSKTSQNSDHKTEHQPKREHLPTSPIYPCHKPVFLPCSFNWARSKAEVLSSLVKKVKKITALPSSTPDRLVSATTASSPCLENQSKAVYISSPSRLGIQTESKPNIKVAVTPLPSPHTYPLCQDTLPLVPDNRAQSVEKTKHPLNPEHNNKFPKCQWTPNLLNLRYLKEALLGSNHSIQMEESKESTSDLVYLKPYTIEGGSISFKTIKNIINSIPQEKIKSDLHKQILLRRMKGCPKSHPGPRVSSSYTLCLICASWIPSGCTHVKGKKDPCRATLVAIPTPIPGSEMEMGIKLIFQIPQQKTSYSEDQNK